jgi:YD repeat-containing protein
LEGPEVSKQSVQPDALAAGGGSGRKSSMSVLSRTWGYNYDAAGRLSNVTQTLGDATPVTFTYTGDKDVSTNAYGNGLLRNRHGYNDQRRITNTYHGVYSYGSWSKFVGIAYERTRQTN